MLKVKYLFASLLAVLTTINVSAQDNGLNPVYKVQIGDITYEKGEASKKLTASKVLGVVADVVEGRVTDIHNEEYIPLAANCVKEGLTHVRRFQTVDADEAADAKYLVTATLTDIAASRKVKTYDRKDSKGREYTETKTYYGAVVTAAFNFKNLQTGEVTTSTISGRCSEYSLAKSADEAIRRPIRSAPISSNAAERRKTRPRNSTSMWAAGLSARMCISMSLSSDRWPDVRHASISVVSASVRP